MTIDKTNYSKNISSGIIVPMFAGVYKDQKMTTEQQNAEISVFDVKALYDMAYSKQSDSEEFRTIMAQAVKMDMAYRRQLKNKDYSGPFGTYRIQTATETKKVKTGKIKTGEAA